MLLLICSRSCRGQAQRAVGDHVAIAEMHLVRKINAFFIVFGIGCKVADGPTHVIMILFVDVFVNLFRLQNGLYYMLL